MQELKDLVAPLCRDCRIIELSGEPWDKRSNLVSNSMGNPYLEAGEQMPVSGKTGKPLHFAFQAFTKDLRILEDRYALIQVFVDLDKIPFETDDPGLIIKTYKTVNADSARETIPGFPQSDDMAIWKYTNERCAPDWDDLPDELRETITAAAGDESPFDAYSDVREELNADNLMKSKIGGYPGWYQGSAYQFDITREDFLFLMDIHTGLKWAWMGAVYLFWNVKKERIEYRFQST